MEAWLISVECLPSQQESIWRGIKEEILQSSSRSLGDCFRFHVPLHFKSGSLDSLVGLADNLGKLDHHLESLLKKIERQYFELEPHAHLTIENPHKDIQESLSVESYLATFQWNDSKYPPSKPLAELAIMIEDNMKKFDDDIKAKTARFQESRNALSSLSKKEGGNLLNKDLADVLTPEIVSCDDFVNTEHLQTVCVILPRKDIKTWVSSYELLDNGVVPRSSKQFEVTDKDDLTLWSVVIFKPSLDNFVSAAKEKRWAVREFSFDPTTFSQQNVDREQAQMQFTVHKDQLEKSCKVLFSELYIALLHLKAMRVFSESVLRFSLPPRFFSVCIQPPLTKERRCSAC